MIAAQPREPAEPPRRGQALVTLRIALDKLDVDRLGRLGRASRLQEPRLEQQRLGRLRDLGTLELFNAAALTTFIVLLGVLPAILMDSINFSVLSLLSRGSG